MAVSLVGDVAPVFKEMGCSQVDLLEYAKGRTELPWPQLDRLITLIIREQGTLIAANRDLTVRIRALSKDRHDGCVATEASGQSLP